MHCCNITVSTRSLHGSMALVHRCLESLAEVEGGWPQYLLDMIAETPLEGITEHGLFYR